MEGGQVHMDSDSSPVSYQWSHQKNPVVLELLDHIAEELAREYVQLMKSTIKKLNMYYLYKFKL